MRKQLSFKDARPQLNQRLKDIEKNRSKISLLLDGLQDQLNIGGLFRTADAARISNIILYKCPIDFNSKKFKKTARSTQQYVPYQIMTTSEELVQYAEKNTLISLEHTSDSSLLSETELNFPLTIVLGNEKVGVSKELLRLSQNAVHLPMLGIQSSLNVCTAGSIAIFELLRRL